MKIASGLVSAEFVSRPNRFVAQVLINGQPETVHVKNAGRCREILQPGTRVWLEPAAAGGSRKTRYSLIAAEKPGRGVINIDSLLPNRLMKDWLAASGEFNVVKPEAMCGGSRFDFYLEKDGRPVWMEVKGCTLEVDGQGFFPDAPTIRGTRHVRELTALRRQGIRTIVAFVIPVNGVTHVLANADHDPAFAASLQEAREAGVEIWHMACDVKPEEVSIIGRSVEQSAQAMVCRKDSQDTD